MVDPAVRRRFPRWRHRSRRVGWSRRPRHHCSRQRRGGRVASTIGSCPSGCRCSRCMARPRVFRGRSPAFAEDLAWDGRPMHLGAAGCCGDAHAYPRSRVAMFPAGRLSVDLSQAWARPGTRARGQRQGYSYRPRKTGGSPCARATALPGEAGFRVPHTVAQGRCRCTHPRQVCLRWSVRTTEGRSPSRGVGTTGGAADRRAPSSGPVPYATRWQRWWRTRARWTGGLLTSLDEDNGTAVRVVACPSVGGSSARCREALNGLDLHADRAARNQALKRGTPSVDLQHHHFIAHPRGRGLA